MAHGIGVVLEARENGAPAIDGPIHISFDIDALDPSYVSSTGTPVENGMHPEEVEAIFDLALKQDKLVSADIVEFNGELGDPEHSILGVQ